MYIENSLLLNGFDVRQLIVGQARIAELSASHQSSMNKHSDGHHSLTSRCGFSVGLGVLPLNLYVFVQTFSLSRKKETR